MTVAELIEKLQTFPSDADLVWYNSYWSCWEDYEDNSPSLENDGTVCIGMF